VSVTPNAFDDGLGGTAYNPEFVFDDGTRARFVVQKTDTSPKYGVCIVLALPQERKRLRGRK
jgi:hypothetical protein